MAGSSAGAVVLACGGALAGFRGMRHRLTLTSSHMVITEPVPDVLDEIGWTGGECVTDSRAMIHYFRTTPDGRIAFGWGGGKVIYGSRTDGRAEVDPAPDRRARDATCAASSRALAGRRIEHAWGGPIDVSPSHLPVVTEVEPGAWAGFGYTGHGVGPDAPGRPLARLARSRPTTMTPRAWRSSTPPRSASRPSRCASSAAR